MARLLSCLVIAVATAGCVSKQPSVIHIKGIPPDVQTPNGVSIIVRDPSVSHGLVAQYVHTLHQELQDQLIFQDLPRVLVEVLPRGALYDFVPEEGRYMPVHGLWFPANHVIKVEWIPGRGCPHYAHEILHAMGMSDYKIERTNIDDAAIRAAYDVVFGR